MKKTEKIWNNLYKSYEKNKPLGIQYPTEAFVIFVSNLKKDKINYFEDLGREYSLRNYHNGKALEIGFGSIANLLMLRDKGFDCYGAEVSREAIKRGNKIIKERNLTKISLKLIKNSKLLYKKNNFDLISGFQSIYYNLNLNKFINSEVYNILKPGGKFIFSFFANDHSYTKYISRYRDNIYYFNNSHPNKRLHGCKFYFFKSKKDLLSHFKSFKKINFFETKSNQTIFKENWWFVTGEK
jgi:SAM-dependent methyltransferase